MCFCIGSGVLNRYAVFFLVVRLVLISPLQNVTRQPHTAQQRTFLNASKQCLASESNVNITEPIWDILSTLSSHPAQSEPPKDSVKLVENFLSSLFLGLSPPRKVA